MNSSPHFSSDNLHLSPSLSNASVTPNIYSPLQDSTNSGNFLARASSLMFIDKAVDDYQIVSGVEPGTEVHILDSTQDAIAQITQILTGRTGIESLHIFSHGSAGALNFASTNLNLGDINSYAPQIQSWEKSFAPHADILLYGCNVAAGESGKEFVLDISKLTGASVAASDNLTGSARLGGDWKLEYSTGKIEARDAIQPIVEAAYNRVLATFTVNSTADVVNPSDGVTTLREAINQANALGGNDSIVFDPSVFANGQTITLNLGQLDITDNLTISSGTNGQMLTINGNNASRVFQIGSKATVNLSGLVITNGTTSDDGGAIYNAGSLTVSNNTIINNSAHRGGGIFNTATLNIASSGISDNKASDGGGIFNDGYFGTSNLTVSNTYIDGNSANQSGGGVANFNGGIFNYSYGSINGNSALSGGGIYNAQGTVNINYSTLQNNTGIGDNGGVVNYDTLNVSNSTLLGGNSGFNSNPNPDPNPNPNPNSNPNPQSNPNPLSNASIRIMPLGDSITQGFTGQNSYRRLLWFDLKNAGYNVDFVGTIRWTTGGITPPTPDFDLDNEGHGGWTSQQILDNVDQFAAEDRPDVVLLHIGTNDLNVDRPPQQIIDNIRGIIQKLRNENPNIKVLLAQIIPDGNPDRSPALNGLIPGLASQISTTQSPVIVVDQYSGFNDSSDTLDTYHPNDTGEWKMATRWFDALKTVL